VIEDEVVVGVREHVDDRVADPQDIELAFSRIRTRGGAAVFASYRLI
jgi:hypothetical protein